MSLGAALILFATMSGFAALPSASVALVVTRSAMAGLGHGIAVAVGIVLGDLVFVAIAVLGLTALAEALGGLFALIKLLGGLYLMWLGGSMLLARAAGTAEASTAPIRAHNLLGSVLAGLLLTLGDLKAILFYASLFPLLVEVAAIGVADGFLIIAITALSVGGVKILYALAARKLAAMARAARAGRGAQRGAGALLLGAGGYLIATAPR